MHSMLTELMLITCFLYCTQYIHRKAAQEYMTDYLQDFLFHVEDEPHVNVSDYVEAAASYDNSTTGTDVALTNEQLLYPDCTPTGVMGWLTGRKHKPISGEKVKITVKFNHYCTIDNPNHRICFSVVGACAKEITLSVAHMKTADEFNEVSVLALSKGLNAGYPLYKYIVKGQVNDILSIFLKRVLFLDVDKSKKMLLLE